jgi:hypothetical protein
MLTELADDLGRGLHQWVKLSRSRSVLSPAPRG